MKLILYFDGASRGNPGPSGAGAYIESVPADKELSIRLSKYLGKQTNNEAEYKSLILGLEKVVDMLVNGLEFQELVIKGDSQLVINQVMGGWKINKKHLQALYAEVLDLLETIKAHGIVYTMVHIRRHLNPVADELANQAIDTR